jgi:histidinol phosphatase-like PHP family hydrolase
VSFLDCHNHTAEWSDGRQSIEQVLQRAREEGVRVGLSDHAGSGEYLNSNDRLLAYADFLSQYPVARGLEMDLGRSFELAPETRKKFDYMIGSVHGMEVDGARLGFSPLIKYLKGGMPDYDPSLVIKDWDKFFTAHLEVLNKEFGRQEYSILGHCTMLPALARSKDPNEAFPEWWEEKLINTLLMHNVCLEISNRWLTPYERLMKKAVDAGMRFSVGSDGHDPAKTCVLDFPKEMIKKYGVKEDRIFDIKRKIEIQNN